MTLGEAKVGSVGCISHMFSDRVFAGAKAQALDCARLYKLDDSHYEPHDLLVTKQEDGYLVRGLLVEKTLLLN